ncbi:MAG: MFS transporter [Acidobacteriota bacterium]
MTNPASARRSPSAADSRATKYVLIATLYVAQAIPLGFFITAMPVILRSEGLPLEYVGLFSVTAAPWLLKFLWAPLIDRYRPAWSARFGARGHYLAWILPLQVFAAITVLGLSALDLGSHLTWIVGLAAVFMLLSATQDIATDGLSVRALTEDERGPGNGLQVGGYYLGQVLGGGLLLWLFDSLGWSPVFWVMAVLLLMPMPWVLRFREPETTPLAERPTVGYGAFRRFFSRPGTAGWVVLLLLFRSGETMATFSFNQMLLELGLGLAEIGLLAGLVYAVGALTGSLAGGLLVARVGRRPALLSLAALQSAAILSYLVPAGGDAGLGVLTGSLLAVSFAGGASTAALYTAMMDASEEDSAGTDFTIQQSLCAIGPVVGTGLSGFSVAALGFGGHFVLCAALAAGAFGLVAGIRLPSERRRELLSA